MPKGGRTGISHGNCDEGRQRWRAREIEHDLSNQFNQWGIGEFSRKNLRKPSAEKTSNFRYGREHRSTRENGRVVHPRAGMGTRESELNGVVGRSMASAGAVHTVRTWPANQHLRSTHRAKSSPAKEWHGIVRWQEDAAGVHR